MLHLRIGTPVEFVSSLVTVVEYIPEGLRLKNFDTGEFFEIVENEPFLFEDISWVLLKRFENVVKEGDVAGVLQLIIQPELYRSCNLSPRNHQ